MMWRLPSACTRQLAPAFQWVSAIDDYVKAMCVRLMSLFVITVSLKGWGSCMDSYCIHLSPILNGGSSEVERFECSDTIEVGWNNSFLRPGCCYPCGYISGSQ